MTSAFPTSAASSSAQESPVAHREPGDGLAVESVAVLETNLDHLSPEELAFACEELLAEGALDVWQTPVVMKKGRLAVVLSVLAAEADAPRLAARVSELTGSLGVRVRTAERFVAPREVLEVATEWGLVRVKAGAGRLRPEHEDVARIARETGHSYADVARRAISKPRATYLGPSTGSGRARRPRRRLRRRTSRLRARR